MLFWLFVGGILAAVSGSILLAATSFLTRNAADGRLRLAAFAFPFICIAWFGAVVIGLGIVDSTFYDRDMIIGDGWYTPLANGYRLVMIDITDTGDICADDPEILCVDPPIADVKTLQLSGSYMLGESTKDGGSFFLFDTRNQRRTDFRSLSQLAKASGALGIVHNLRPVYDVYLDYRATWLDYIAIVVAFIPPALGFLLGFLWVLRLRRRAA